jgi:hypothetical protein
MRLNLRLKFGNLTFFGMISKTQTLEGITSTVNKKEHLHYIFWDLENCTLEQAEKTLKEVQEEFLLSNIYITSDKDKSYRAWCFSVRKWLDYLHILLHTKYVDYGFWIWTVRRGEATLRTSKKENRNQQEIVSVLYGFLDKTNLPEKVKIVIYDTGIEKKGKLITNYR